MVHRDCGVRRRWWHRDRLVPALRNTAEGNAHQLAVVPAHVVDRLRALVLGMGLSKLHSDGGLSCLIVRPSSRVSVVPALSAFAELGEVVDSQPAVDEDHDSNYR